jgi:hypothetical protein
MVNVLANWGIVMCHIFIQNKVEMPPRVNIICDSSKDENPRANICANDDKAS